MVVKFLSASKHCDSSDDEGNITDDSDRQHGRQREAGAE
jgi:hypothetical protein